MNPPRAAIGILVLFLLTAAGVAYVLGREGVSGPALAGLLLGAALGGANLLLESLSLGWALGKKPSATLVVSLVGFGLRLVVVCVLTLVFAGTAGVDAVTFALTYVASFFLFLGILIWAVSRWQGKAVSPREGTE